MYWEGSGMVRGLRLLLQGITRLGASTHPMREELQQHFTLYDMTIARATTAPFSPLMLTPARAAKVWLCMSGSQTSLPSFAALQTPHPMIVAVLPQCDGRGSHFELFGYKNKQCPCRETLQAVTLCDA